MPRPDTKEEQHPARDPRGTDSRERSHERSPDDPGRGQGDILDDQIPEAPDHTAKQPR